MSNDSQDETGDQNGQDTTAADVQRGVQTGAQIAEGAVGAVSSATSGDAAGTVSGLAGIAGAAGGAAGGDAGRAVETGAQATQGVMGAARAASSGDAAGTVGGLAGATGAVAGAAGGEAGEAVRTGAQVVQAGAQIVGAIQRISARGEGGASGSGASGDASAEARREGLTGTIERASHIDFHLEVQGASGQWAVEQVSLSEALNTVPTCQLRARYQGHIDEAELLQKNVRLTIERRSSEHVRSFRGIVWHARVEPTPDEEQLSVVLQVTPALALLGCIQDSRIFQEKTVVDVVKEVFERALGDRGRSIVDEDLDRVYERREYVVQYDETSLHFLTRLCEEEGIFFYFDHETETETLRLADGMGRLRRARPDAGGEVPYDERPDQAPDGEAVFGVLHRVEVGPTDVVVADHDWTHPTLDIRGTEVDHGEHSPPALEIFDHTDALVFHSFDGQQYGGHTAKIQAKLRRERQDLERQHWEAGSTVITAVPGTTLLFTGCPEAEHDQRYLIVASSAHGSATAGAAGRFEARLDLVPTQLEYRARRRTRRPLAHGPELATVVGPPGEEIHTDVHGRVRVHFPWDRHHDRAEETSSCWMRVSHHWAGPGFGTFFLPRIGMEVLVSFLGGNPDRPLVTGCVYHGENRVGVELDAKKTQSLIRTKSSPDSAGFNEIRFEDESGAEFIFVHAQKDYNEVVEHDHSTRVKNCQSNTVDANQSETVGGNQTMTVHKKRTKTVDEDEENTVHQSRTTRIDKNDEESVGGDRSLHVEGNESITIDLDRKLHVIQKTIQNHDGGRSIEVGTGDALKVTADRGVDVTGNFDNTVTGRYTVQQGGTETIHIAGNIFISSASKIELQAPGCVVKMEGGRVVIDAANEIALSSGGASVLLKSDGTIAMAGSTKVAADGGGAKLELTANGVKAEGNFVEASANAVMTLTGTLIKLN